MSKQTVKIMRVNPENHKLSKRAYIMMKQAYYNEQIVYGLAFQRYLNARKGKTI